MLPRAGPARPFSASGRASFSALVFLPGSPFPEDITAHASTPRWHASGMPPRLLPVPALTPPAPVPGPGGLVLVGAADAATDQAVAGLLRQLTGASGRLGCSVVLVGAREPLRHQLALASTQAGRRYVAVGTDADQGTWNPLDTCIPGSRGLAELVVQLDVDLSGTPFPAVERPLALDLLSHLLAVGRLLTGARAFEPADLADALASSYCLCDMFDRAVACVYDQYEFLLEIGDDDYRRLATRLQAVTIFPEDIADGAASDPAAPPLGSGILADDGVPRRYEFRWRPQRGRYAVLVGDRGLAVLRWLFSSKPYRAPLRGRPAVPFGRLPYATYQLAAPASGDLRTLREGSSWVNECWLQLPNGVQRRIRRRLHALAARFAAPRLREAFSPRRAQRERRTRRESVGALDDLVAQGGCLALALPDAETPMLRRAVAALLRRQWQAIAPAAPAPAPALVCDRYERLLTGSADARSDAAHLYGGASGRSLLVAVVRSPLALVEATGSPARARRLLSAFGRMAVLPGALTRAAGLGPYLHRRLHAAAQAVVETPPVVERLFAAAGRSGGAAVPASLSASRSRVAVSSLLARLYRPF